jgi:hypothetical protein
MTIKERTELVEKIFSNLHNTQTRADFLLLLQSFQDEIIELTFETQHLRHELNKFNNE